MIPLKVLFAEDDRVDQLAFERFVEEHGLPITYLLAGSLNEAKCLVTQGEFDVIVADYSLGDGTALDLLPFAAGVPVILLTGVGDEQIAARAFTAGVCDYLVKDIGRNYLERLPERMEHAVGRRLRSAEAVRESEGRYRTLIENMGEGIGYVNPEEQFAFANAASEDIFGVPPGGLLGRSLLEFVKPEQFGMIREQTDRRRAGEKSVYEFEISRPNGEKRDLLVTAVPQFDNQGKFVGTFGVFRDITERKRVEEALRESEAQYRLLADHMKDQVWLMDLNLKPTYISPSVEKVRGYTFEEIAQLPLDKQLTATSYQSAMEFFSIELPKALADPTYFARSLELEFCRKDGSTLWVETMFTLIWDENGKPLSLLGVGRDITERMKAEESLRESEERYRRILDLSREGIWVLDEQFRTTFVNSQMSQLLGYPSEEIIGHPMEEFLLEEDIPNHQREMQERKMMIDSQYERRFRCKDGSVVWAIVSARALLRDAAFQGSFLMLTDLTERKKTEEALKESEEKYRLLIENQTDLVAKMDLEYRFLFVSPSYCKMFGKTEEELLGKTFLPLVHEDDLEGTANALRGIVRPPYTSFYEQRAMTKDGWRWFAWSGTAVLDDDQNVTAIISVGRDIAERKRAEEELQKSEEMYRILVDNAGESLVVAQGGMLRFTNPKAEEVTGFSQAELTSVPFLELIHPEDRQRVGLNYQRRIRGEPAEDTYDFRIVRKDGTHKWVEIHAVLISWQGAPATLNFMTDITERKLAEEALALNFETQAAMNALLGLSLESRTINEFLERSLDLVLSLKWLAVESKGAIFLADKAGETLHLHVHKGLPKNLSTICSTVPFGRCMCGRAAAARAVQFADRVDERHDTRYEGMLPHGHYCVPVLSGDHILGVINLYVKEGHSRSSWEEDFLKAVANTFAGTIERRRAEEALTETHEKLRQSWESTILVLASVVEMRDPYTAGHQQRVSELAQAIALELGLPEAQVDGIRVAGLLHDLGKIQIPAETLSKPGKLTSVELMLIRMHSQNGYEILKPTVFPWPIAQFVLQHHERCDGSGYPAGLKGEEILLEARILAVADVVEAMSSHRPYRPAFGVHEALWEILQNKGTLYDVAVAEACQRVFEERQFQFRSQVG